jgi:hypothetical protein
MDGDRNVIADVPQRQYRPDLPIINLIWIRGVNHVLTLSC